MSQTTVRSAAGVRHPVAQQAIDFGYLTPAQVERAYDRQKQLERGGIFLPIAQVLRQMNLLSPAQLRALLQYALQHDSHSNDGEVSTGQFGRFEILKVLSESVRARIYKARDTANGQLVVLKIMPNELLRDKDRAERFKRELALTSKLKHPNICAAYGHEIINECPTLVLEYVVGSSLKDRLEREGNVPEKTAWRIALEVAKALAHAAGSGIIHRDIKPANIICGEKGEVKLAEFGLAKSLREVSALTAEGTTVGTPFYISPEQARGDSNIDGRTDVYSLGCAVYEMLTGSVPFYGDTVPDVMLKHTREARPDPRELLPEIGAESAALVMRMMAINPADRPASAQELLGLITALLAALPEPVSAARPVYDVKPTAAEVPLAPAAAPTTPAPAAPRSGQTTTLKREVAPTPSTPQPGPFARCGAWLDRLLGLSS